MSIHSEAAKNIKLGERYRVMCKVPDYNHGWGSRWIDDMDDAVGQVYTIESVNDSAVRFEERDCAWPAHALMPEFSISGAYFKVDDHVRVARKSEGFAHGWNAGWNTQMAPGIVGCITDISTALGCKVGGWWYPEWCLEHAPTEDGKVEILTELPKFQVGDKGKTRGGFDYKILRNEPNTDKQYSLVVKVDENGDIKERRHNLDGIWSTIQKNHKFDLMPPTSRVEVASSKAKIDFATLSPTQQRIWEKTHVYFNAPKLHLTTKEPAMKNPKIETITFVDGERIDSLSQDCLFNMIAGIEAEIERLNKIGTKPKALHARIDKLSATIVELVALSDSKDA